MSDTDAQAPADDGGALSMDQVVALRVARRAAQPEAATEAEKPADEAPEASEAAEEGEEDQPADQTADDEGAADDDPPSADDEADEGEAGGDDAGPPIDPPHFWTPEDKALFAQLPREAQDRILTYEKQRVASQNQVIEQARTASKQYEEAQKAAQEHSQRLQTLLPQAERLFVARWKDVDLLEIAKNEGQEYAEAVRQQCAEEQAVLEDMKTAAEQAERDWFVSFTQAEAPKLLAAIPDLVDEAKRPRILSRINTLLQAEGYTSDEIKLASARDLKIAHKAALYDELMASRLSTPTPKPAAPAPRPVRPASAQPANTNQRREVERLERRAAQTHALEDVVAARLARKQLAR